MKIRDMIPTQWGLHNEPVKYDPDFSAFSLHGDMDRLFDHLTRDFFETARFDFRPTLGYANVPRVDVTETDTEFQVSAELPGMDEKDLDVSLHDGTLTIKGEKKMEKEDKQKEFYRMERSYGSFQRSFLLPDVIDQDNIDASFKNGVLNVTLPKTPEAKKEVRKIDIHSN